MTHHLHIAFAGAGGQLSIVVRNGGGETLDAQQRPGEGTERLDWQALIFALQYAAEQRAGAVTLYGHQECIQAMEQRRWVVDGKYKAKCIIIQEDWYAYNLMAWTIILGNFAGSTRFHAISEAANVALWALTTER